MKRGLRHNVGVIGLLICGLVGVAGAADKVKPEEVVAKHLDAIGSIEARTAKTLRSGNGTASMDVLSGGAGHMDGTTTVASMDKKFNFVMFFNAPQYVGEQFKFDG